MLSTILLDPAMRAPPVLPKFSPGDFCQFFLEDEDTNIYGKIVSYDYDQKTYCVTTSHKVNVTIYPEVKWSHIKTISRRDYRRMKRQVWPDIMNPYYTDRILPPAVLRDRRERKRARNDA